MNNNILAVEATQKWHLFKATGGGASYIHGSHGKGGGGAPARSTTRKEVRGKNSFRGGKAPRGGKDKTG